MKTQSNVCEVTSDQETRSKTSTWSIEFAHLPGTRDALQAWAFYHERTMRVGPPRPKKGVGEDEQPDLYQNWAWMRVEEAIARLADEQSKILTLSKRVLEMNIARSSLAMFRDGETLHEACDWRMGRMTMLKLPGILVEVMRERPFKLSEFE